MREDAIESVGSRRKLLNDLEIMVGENNP